MELTPPDRPRRAFLRAAAGASLLGALAGARAPAAATPAAGAAAPTAKAGYHETEHIRTYYRSARYW